MSLDFQDFEGLFKLNATSSIKEVLQVTAKFEEAFGSGEGDAGFALGYFYHPESELSESVKSQIGASHEKSDNYFRQAYALFTQDALTGNGRSMHFLANYYQSGLPPVSCDIVQYEYWIKKARKAGYKGAGGQL